MTASGPRSMAVRALRCGLRLSALGLVVAAALYLANPWIGFPGWAFGLWPTAILMMGLSGLSERAACLWMVAIVASNGIWYFMVGAMLAPPVILARRSLARWFGSRGLE